jgi:predicted  nucleic acid-binding Zn-ribbon protein
MDAPIAEVESDLARLRVQRRELETALAFQTERGERLEKELTELRQKHTQLQAVFTRERERIRRTLTALREARAAWLSERGQTPASNSAALSGDNRAWLEL